MKIDSERGIFNIVTSDLDYINKFKDSIETITNPTPTKSYKFNCNMIIDLYDVYPTSLIPQPSGYLIEFTARHCMFNRLIYKPHTESERALNETIAVKIGKSTECFDKGCQENCDDDSPCYRTLCVVNEVFEALNFLKG